MHTTKSNIKNSKKELLVKLFLKFSSDLCVKIPQPYLFITIQHKFVEPAVSTFRQCPHECKAETTSLTSDTESDLIHGNEIENTKIDQNIKPQHTSRKRKGGQAKGKGKRSKKKKQILTIGEYISDCCDVCKIIYQEDEEWICCVSCSVWYHRVSIELGDADWKYFSKQNAVFICPLCRYLFHEMVRFYHDCTLALFLFCAIADTFSRNFNERFLRSAIHFRI